MGAERSPPSCSFLVFLGGGNHLGGDVLWCALPSLLRASCVLLPRSSSFSFPGLTELFQGPCLVENKIKKKEEATVCVCEREREKSLEAHSTID